MQNQERSTTHLVNYMTYNMEETCEKYIEKYGKKD